MNLIEQAKQLATQRHVLDNKQVYMNILPYTHHLLDVENVLASMGITDEIMVACAWCHDLIEDTRGKQNQLKVRDLEELLGEDVARIVDAVSTVEGPDRTTRNALTYPRIRAVGEQAVIIKLADRIANVRCGGRKIGSYKKEWADFRHGLYVPEMCAGNSVVHRMWNILGGLMEHA